MEIRTIGVLDLAEPVRVVARRSGRSIEGELVPSGANRAGEAEVDGEGRCFLYVEALRGEDRLEAWIPVIVGTETHAPRRMSLYLASNDESASSSQIIAGLVLLAMTGTLLGWTAIGVCSVGRMTSGRPVPHST